MAAVLGGALRLLHGSQLHQAPNLPVQVPLDGVLRLREILEEHSCRSDVLACSQLTWELHAAVVVDVTVDQPCALSSATYGVPALRLGTGPRGM